MYYACVFFVVLAAFISNGLATRPNDEIFLSDFNQSYYIANETYTFRLMPVFQIPLQLYRHALYTATTDVVLGKTKRALLQHKDSLYELAPEDYAVLEQYMEVPSYVKVNTKKRSLPVDRNGYRVIPLAKKATILYAPGEPTEKRAASQAAPVAIGTKFCLHIPFFTTCDNSQDLTDVKASLQASTDEFRQELDSYKKTNDLRANEMAVTLSRQRDLISALVQETIVTNTFISNLASTTATNAAQIAHGDFVVHSQIDYLSRITNSLLRYSNALASTDPRSLVAQPAMSKLFEGYIAVIDYLKNQNDPPMTPILDSRTFTWTEVPLATQSVRNVVTFTEPYLDTATQQSILQGFRVTTAMTCKAWSSTRCTTTASGTPAMVAANTAGNGDNWIFGPFHQQHIGIYNVMNSTPTFGTYSVTNVNVFNAAVTSATTSISGPVAYGSNGVMLAGSGTTLYCVDFLGYKMLSTFDSTPYMLNGIPVGVVSNDMSQCNNYQLRNRFTAAGKNTYFLFGIISGVVVPFYSTCTADALITDTNTTTPIGYLFNFPTTDPVSLTGVNSSLLYTNYEMNAQHQVGANCAINMEPEWLGMNYYIPVTNTKVIPSVPRGYKLTQFTINPAGELASSLEFLYTQDWAWAYTVQRLSNNNIIVDEVNVLDGSTVLFHLDGNTVVDESDSFYGEGNNGRDCVRFSSQYEYDILSCFFQNDQTAYTADQYLAGAIQTTGIARFNNKFDFSFDTQTSIVNVPLVPGNPNATVYQFSLKPKIDSDFSFSVSADGSICPRVILATSSVSGCQYQFAYTGSQQITFGPDIIRFNTDKTSNVTLVLFTDPSQLVRSLDAGGKQCALLQCVYGGTAETSTVRVNQPKVQIVSADDKALRARVSFIIDTLNSTINNMSTVQDQVALSNERLAYIIGNLSTLNFNVTKLVPYEDFTALRAQVDQMINNLQPGSTDCSGGVFGSAACFGKDILNTILVIVVIGLLVLAGYVVCFKFGLASKLCGRSD